MNHYAIYLALLNSTSSWHRYMHLVTTVIPNFERKTDRFRGTVQASSCYTGDQNVWDHRMDVFLHLFYGNEANSDKPLKNKKSLELRD